MLRSIYNLQGVPKKDPVTSTPQPAVRKKLSAAQVRAMLPHMAFNTLLGIELHRVHEDGLTIRCAVAPHLLNSAKVLHGGATATLCDAAVGMATARHYGGRPITTVELKVNYFRPIASGRVYARAKLLRTGSTLAVGEVSILDEAGHLCGFAIVTYILLDARGTSSALPPHDAPVSD
jgi:acyl-CoA thioesterase